MRERDINRKLFHRGHYEVVAGRFRHALEPMLSATATTDDEYLKEYRLAQSSAITNLAIDMALRFQADNEDFDPTVFLTRCSPDPEKWPLAELWEEVTAQLRKDDVLDGR